MQKIGNITSTADANGEWTNGNVAGGTPPTLIDAAWLNTVQRELAGVVIGSGLTLDPKNDAQVLAALKKLFLQTGNNFSEIKDAGAVAVAAALSNLGLGTASTRTVGAGTNQIPDMNLFTSSTTWFKLPSGKIVQMGNFSTTAAGNTIINLPIPFPTACRSIVVTQQDTTFPNLIGCIPLGTTQLRATTWNYNGGAVSGTSVAYIAIGD